MRRLIAAILLIVVAACQPASPPARKTLRISFCTSPTTVDPRKSGDFVSSTLICLLYEGLTRCKGGSEVELALAERVDISSDQKTYLFHLRKSAWTDGTPVTAYDFEKSWKKILQPGFPSLCAYLLYPIKNAERCAKGIGTEDEVGIRCLDPYTLQIELERPTPYFLSLTAFPLFLPFPSHIEESQSLNSGLVCNGPFIIDKVAEVAEIVLEKNPSFWNPSQIHLDAIHISIVSDETTALQMFERGELDWLGGPLAPLPPDALQNLKGLHFLPMAASTFCTFNIETFPFQNDSLRAAFSLAIDREQIVRKIAQVGQAPAARILPPSLIGAQAKPLVPSRNVEEARRQFKAGIEELGISPSDLKTTTLYFKGGQTDKRLAQALKEQWKEVLGVEIQIEQIDPKSHMQRLHERNYQIALASFIAQFHDAVNILDRFKDKKNPKNFPGWESEQYAKLLEKAALTLDPGERLAILAKAEEILASSTVVAPLYHWSAPTLFNPRVQNFTTTSSGGVLFERCSLEPDP